LQQVSLPSNVSGVNLNQGILNAQGYIADIGSITTTTGTATTTGTNHALLLIPAPIIFIPNSLKTDSASLIAENVPFGNGIGLYGQLAKFTNGNFTVQGGVRGIMTQSVWSDPSVSPGYECNTTLGNLGDAGGMFEVTVTNLPAGSYTANLTIICAAYSINSMSNAAVHITGSNTNQYLLDGQGTGSTPFGKKKTLNITITPDSSGTAIIAISKPRLSAEQGGQANEGVVINVNSVTAVSN